jgi:hypothetical protein
VKIQASVTFTAFTHGLIQFTVIISEAFIQVDATISTNARQIRLEIAIDLSDCQKWMSGKFTI